MAFEFDFDIKNLSCWIKIESWRKGNCGLAVNWNNPIRDAGQISLKLQDRLGIKSKLEKITDLIINSLNSESQLLIQGN